MRQAEFFLSFWVIFGPFTSPPTDLENQNFEKMKKRSEDIIILQMCTKNDSHMTYDSWHMECNRQDFFVILDQFLPFNLSNNLKDQNFEKMKKPPGDIIILHRRNINDDHIMYGSCDNKRDRQNYLPFWTIFCPFTPLTTQKIKILKNWKYQLEISFYTCAR